MKKMIGILLFLCILLYPSLTVSSIKKYDGNELVKVIISFDNNTVTTKNLNEKLQNIEYQLKYVKIKIKLDYIDETLERKINSLSFVNCNQLEKDYQILLRKFGMHEEIERLEKNGVQLSSVTIITKQKNLNGFLEQGYKVYLI